MGTPRAGLAGGREPLAADHAVADGEPASVQGTAVGVGEVAPRAEELATNVGTPQLDPSRDAEAFVEMEVAAGTELPCVKGWDMRSAQADRCRCCLAEGDSAGEGTVQEREGTPQRGGLKVEVAGDAGSLQAHTSDDR